MEQTTAGCSKWGPSRNKVCCWWENYNLSRAWRNPFRDRDRRGEVGMIHVPRSCCWLGADGPRWSLAIDPVDGARQPPKEAGRWSKVENLHIERRVPGAFPESKNVLFVRNLLSSLVFGISRPVSQRLRGTWTNRYIADGTSANECKVGLISLGRKLFCLGIVDDGPLLDGNWHRHEWWWLIATLGRLVRIFFWGMIPQ